jgi:hypothetical protein
MNWQALPAREIHKSEKNVGTRNINYLLKWGKQRLGQLTLPSYQCFQAGK